MNDSAAVSGTRRIERACRWRRVLVATWGARARVSSEPCTEVPVVRPYWLVDDIEAALAAALETGAEVAHPPMEIRGHGSFAIYVQGGIHHGLWQRYAGAGS